MEERQDKYRRDGTPYPPGDKGLFEWGNDLKDRKNCVVGFDNFENGVEVSTIWIGLDHNYGDNNRPLIFESMVFVPAHKEYWVGGLKRVIKRDEVEMWRYSTEEEARLGHKMLCKKWGRMKSANQVLKGADP